MADLITWKTVTAPSVAAELAEARKAQEGIGAAFDSLGSRVEDYAADKQKSQTDAFIADLNAAANDEERQKMISAAESEWLNMGRVTEAARAAEVHDFARSEDARADTRIKMQKERDLEEALENARQADMEAEKLQDLREQFEIKQEFLEESEKNRALEAQQDIGIRTETMVNARDHQEATEEYNKMKLADQIATNAEVTALNKTLRTQSETKFKQEQKDYKAAQKIRKDEIIKRERELAEDTKKYNYQQLMIKVQNTAADLDRGSTESKEYLDAQAKLLRKAGMPRELVRTQLQRLRDLDLAESVGLSEEAGAKVDALGFVILDPKNPPSIFEFKRYRRDVAKIVRDDNPGVSAAAIKAKVTQITDNEEFRHAEALAEQIQENIKLQDAARIGTEAEIVADGQAFHKSVVNKTELAHIEKLLRKEHKDAYKIMSQEDLRDDIQLTLKAMYEHYNPKTDQQRSALAKVVYKLYAMSRADKGGMFDQDVIGVPGTEYGLLFDTSLGELAENNFTKLQQSMSSLGLLPSESKLPPGERKIESAKQALLPQKDRRKSPPALSTWDKYKIKQQVQNPATSVTISDKFKNLIK